MLIAWKRDLPEVPHTSIEPVSKDSMFVPHTLEGSIVPLEGANANLLLISPKTNIQLMAQDQNTVEKSFFSFFISVNETAGMFLK